MVTFNFEEDLKKKLADRTIQPSEKSWEWLSTKLEKQEKSKDPKIIWWLGIAASIVGVLLVSWFYFSNVESTEILPEMVDNPVENKENKNIKLQDDNSIVKYEKVQNEEVVSQKVEINNTINHSKNKSSKKNELILKDSNSLVASMNKETNPKVEIVNNELINEPNKLDTAIAINEVQDLDAEIEFLLKKAQNRVALNSTKTDNNFAVEASLLLEEVELDLEESFREKIFKTVISSYSTIKTAVAERNN